MHGTYVSLDLETTGVNHQVDKIIEVGLVKLVDGEVKDCYHTLVNPGVKLPVKIKRLTGLNDENLSDKPIINEILPDIIDFIGDFPLIGHNVMFDRDFLATALGSTTTNPIPNQLYDTLDLAKFVLPDAPNHRLTTLCKVCNIDLSQQHRAYADALGAALLAVELLRRLSVFELPLLRDLITLLEVNGSPWCGVIEDMAKHAAKEIANRKISSISGLKPIMDEFSVGLFEEEEDERDVLPLNEDDVVNCLGDNGLLSRTIERYEYRPQQIAMAKSVTQSLNDDIYMLAEAGTGTGKSMAYLVPAVLWAQKNNRRVVISTHTINLQEQLWNKDIPLLQSLPDFNFKAALVKGRSNYICLRRWYAELSSPNLKVRDAGFYARILVWLTTTETGDRTELNINWQEVDLWNNICAESDGCLGKRCGFFHRTCFVSRMKKRAENANIIIANHSLVCADIKADNRVLPPYKVLIFDEAHHLESTATDHLGTIVTKVGITRWLGLVNKTTARLNNMPAPGNHEQWVDRLNKLKELQFQVKEATEVFFELMAELLVNSSEANDIRYTLRLKPGFDLTNYKIDIENLVQRIKTLSAAMMQVAEDMEGHLLVEENETSKEIALLAENGFSLATDIEFTCDCSNNDNVYWLDGYLANSGQVYISLHAAPVEVGTLLHSLLYVYKDTIIFASATLTVDGSFNHFIERNGLNLVDPERLVEIKVDSPFQYDDQSLLYIIDNFPDQRSIPEPQYLNLLAETIGDLATLVGGRTLVLFTAHKILKKVYYQLKPSMEEQDILLLGHDIDGSRTRLVEEFKQNNKAVLFGASSFWEGLDIPGESLSCVILVKLPFWPPNAPLVAARTEALYKNNKDGFYHFSLPEAIIKFKQGFGRLIRTKYDRGAVIVLDRRIVDKKYGRKFLNSLPISTYMRGDKQLMLSKVKNIINDQ
ncbi:helicase C-terminal domain-containing protein [Peptococcaceae bacterium 1198_IL3148]